MNIKLLLLGILSWSIIALGGCASLNKSHQLLSDMRNIKTGTKQADIHKKFGIPTSTLSGLYGDVYLIGGEKFIIYYEFNPKNGFPVTHIKEAYEQ